MKNRVKYDFIGHITYPYTEESKGFFFKQNKTKKVTTIMYDGTLVGKYISKISSGKELSEFLKDIGYEVKEIELKNIESRISIPAIKIHCNNAECRHCNEKTNGICTINIKASVETLKNHKNKIIEKNIIVSYGAQDIRELTTKSECLLWYINKCFGFEGIADVYGKTEMC